MKIIKIGAMWCPACIITNKYWKNLKEKYNDIEFIDYDLDLDDEEVKKYNIGKTLPEIIIFDSNNKEIKRVIGEKSLEELEKEIGDVYEK
jgi:thiol-disulfide isomerase/thioredoxin